uniref:Uncharacterized protein AlNc14C142G7282 n=1 Tax=Albugo laibachii Nc14 TaxID=890382 RepID=F0WL93_9STRA|nr:conserved hypothetical protein [Albugo laibachii Nc14]|eukprot:CCA22055.1 conserved hypothetical protein [Albugo laibachii Nc14]
MINSNGNDPYEHHKRLTRSHSMTINCRLSYPMRTSLDREDDPGPFQGSTTPPSLSTLPSHSYAMDRVIPCMRMEHRTICRHNQWEVDHNGAGCYAEKMDKGPCRAMYPSLPSQRSTPAVQENARLDTYFDSKVAACWTPTPIHAPSKQIWYPQRRLSEISDQQLKEVMGSSSHIEASHMAERFEVSNLNVKEFTLNELRPFFNKPMTVVAKELGVCITLMKKICRKNGLNRWPHRRIRSIINQITSLEALAGNPININRKRIQARIQKLRKELGSVIENPNSKSRKAQADARVRSTNEKSKKRNSSVENPASLPDSKDKIQSDPSNGSDESIQQQVESDHDGRSSSNFASYDLGHQRNLNSISRDQSCNCFGCAANKFDRSAHPISRRESCLQKALVSKRVANGATYSRASILAILNEPE